MYVSGIDHTHIGCYTDLVARASPKNNKLERKATNMCNQSELISKVEALKEWQALLEEAETMVESLKDFIKAEM